MAAAVSDYRPASVAPGKVKKTDGPVVLELVRTPDILQALGKQKGRRILVGFAAETENVLAYAQGKVQTKNLDLIVANDVGQAEGGFGSDQNAALLIDASGVSDAVPLVSKRELAERILDRVVALRRARGPKQVATTA
jgi:phosphopantothenoylcysteine decarboxylase/phosphopantothenate--cysteine ligase